MGFCCQERGFGMVGACIAVADGGGGGGSSVEFPSKGGTPGSDSAHPTAGGQWDCGNYFFPEGNH